MIKESSHHDTALNAYEELINQSILFVIDKEKEPILYKNEAYKLVQNIATYLFMQNESGNELYGEEIMQTAIDCVKSYNPSFGTPIIHYCNAAWSKNKRRAFIKNEEFNNQGNVHYNKKTMQIIQKYVRLAEKTNKDCFSENYVCFIADCTGKAKDEVIDYIRLIKEGIAYADVITADGEGVNLLDLYAAQRPNASVCDSGAESLILIQNHAKNIDYVFSGLQERQKGYISKLLTLKIMNEEGMDDITIDSMIQYEFFDKELCRRIISNEKITARIIADEHGMSEQSISRGYREFLEKLKKFL